MGLKPDEVIYQTFTLFSKQPNAFDLGQRVVGLENGTYPAKTESLFIPSTSPFNGYLISRLEPIQKPKAGQVELGLAYSKIGNLQNARKPGGVERLFQTHLNPPGGEWVGIVKVFGTVMHFGYQMPAKELSNLQVKPAKYQIETPFNVIVVTGLNLDQRFNRLSILEEAVFKENAPQACLELVLNDLKALPTYSI